MLLAPTKHWKLHDPAPAAFFASVPEHPLLAQILYNRRLRSAGEIAAFLTGNDAVQENPYRLKDMVPAVRRILQAIETDETICVYGDFDADGVTSTALLVGALQAAGAEVGPYIPSRVDEGYGLNPDAITAIAARAQLLITVDCGIRAVAEVQQAVDLGMDVIVTDHHTVGAVLPPALAVINPQRADCTGCFRRLAGVGVAYRLAQATLRAVAHQPWSALTPDQAAELETELLDLVAIGTVADMMPLRVENRDLVRRGLVQLNQTQRPGLSMLMEYAGVGKGRADATSISFAIAPRINAAGRLAHANLAYKLLRTTDPTDAHTWTRQLEALNQQRRKLTAEAEAEAAVQVAAQMTGGGDETTAGEPPPIVIAGSANFPSGIVGLVAGRLVDRYYRPAVVMERGERTSRGSARSIEEFDISAALDELSPMLVRHGGHHRAAGFTVETGRLEAFTDALRAIAARDLAAHDDLRPTLEIDAIAPLDELNWGVQGQLARLEPTGQENPAPLLLIPNARVRSLRAVGGDKHLKLVLEGGAGKPVMDAIAFGHGERLPQLSKGMRLDVVGELNVNEWNGRRQLQIMVKDFRAAETG